MKNQEQIIDRVIQNMQRRMGLAGVSVCAMPGLREMIGALLDEIIYVKYPAPGTKEFQEESENFTRLVGETMKLANESEWPTCQMCKGTSYYIDETCDHCHGGKRDPGHDYQDADCYPPGE